MHGSGTLFSEIAKLPAHLLADKALVADSAFAHSVLRTGLGHELTRSTMPIGLRRGPASLVSCCLSEIYAGRDLGRGLLR